VKAYSGTQDGRDSSHTQVGSSIERGTEVNITAIRCQRVYIAASMVTERERGENGMRGGTLNLVIAILVIILLVILILQFV
jgi:hypothetical protein